MENCESEKNGTGTSNIRRFNFNFSRGSCRNLYSLEKAKHILQSDAVIPSTSHPFFFFLELLEFSEDRNPWESVEEKLYEIR